MIDRHHMYLYGSNKRVNLEARDGVYDAIVGGKVYQFDEGLERLLVYHSYVFPSEQDFSEILQLNVPGITPLEIQKFQEQFKLTHIPDTVEPFGLDTIPAYANKETGMYIPAADFKCDISLADEQQLLYILTQDPPEGQTALSQIELWFRSYCSKYNLHYKQDSGNEHTDLAATFLMIHGISPVVAKNIRHTITPEEKKEIRTSKVKGTILLYVLIFIWLLTAVGIMLAGDALMDKDGSFILGAIMLILGFAVLAVPISRFVDMNR